MADKKLQCPNCGGPNTISEGLKDQKCVFCGTTFISKEVEDNTTNIKPENDKIYNWMMMAETAREGGDHNEAINYYNKILEENSSHAASWFGKGTSIIWSSKLGDIKMKEALSYYKNAIKFSNGKEMEKAVADELNSVVGLFYLEIASHYRRFRKLTTAEVDFYSRFITLDAGLAFGLVCNPDNEQLIDNGIYLVNELIKTIGAKYAAVLETDKIKEKYIKEKKRLKPDWEEPKSSEPKSSTGSGCFVATATMGDYNHPAVLQLRFFRDAYLLQRNWGRIFTRFYYKWGPYPANVIKKSDVLKKLSYYIIVKPLSFISSKLIEKK